jgi:hypothetical protein
MIIFKPFYDQLPQQTRGCHVGYVVYLTMLLNYLGYDLRADL